MKTNKVIYTFEELTTTILRDGINTILVMAGKAAIDANNPALVALAEQHGGKPETKSKAKKRGKK